MNVLVYLSFRRLKNDNVLHAALSAKNMMFEKCQIIIFACLLLDQGVFLRNFGIYQRNKFNCLLGTRFSLLFLFKFFY